MYRKQTSNIATLRLHDLPLISDKYELAELMRLSLFDVSNVLLGSRLSYRRVEIPKRSGGVRTLHIPSITVMAMQSWILRMILDKVRPSNYATAYVKGTSIIDNVKPHRYNRYFLSLDIKDFFPSIKLHQVEFLFSDIGYSSQVASMLAKICMCGSSLPQGGVTSPAIANLVVSRLDRRIAGYCGKKKIVYTRYADDLTFSSNNRNILNHAEEILTSIIRSEGYEVNSEKTRFSGPRTCCSVTGLIKNSSTPKFGIGRKKKLAMRSVIFNYIVNDKFVNPKYGTKQSIIGWLNYCNNVDEDVYNYLENYANRLDGNNVLFNSASTRNIDGRL